MKIVEILCHGPGPATSFVTSKSMGTFHTKKATEVKRGICNSFMFQTIFSKSGIKLGKLVFTHLNKLNNQLSMNIFQV